MLRWRILLGVTFVAALVGLCWLDHYFETVYQLAPGLCLFPLAVICIVLGTQEILRLAAAANIRPLAWTVHLGNLLLLASNWLPVTGSVADIFAAGQYSPGPSNKPLFALAIAMLLVLGGEMYRFQKPGGGLANVSVAVFTIVYLGLTFSCMAQLRLAWGIWALASLIIVVKAGDTGAYTVGRLLGRTKMAPILSPGKTVEGAVGALTFSCAASWMTFGWLLPLLGGTGGQPWGWIPFGLLVGATGIMGDLAESLIKRDVGLKDSSGWLPGFGGVMDLVDSLLLAAPAAWFCWTLELVGR